MRQPVAVNIALQTALADLRWSCSCATTLPDFGCGLLTRLPHTCKTRKVHALAVALKGAHLPALLGQIARDEATSQVLAPEVPGMGAAVDRVLALGASVLRRTARERKRLQYSLPVTGFQVDSHFVSLLEGAQAVRRSATPVCTQSSSSQAREGSPICGSAVENRGWIQQTRNPTHLTDHLRCLCGGRSAMAVATATADAAARRRQ